MRFDPAEGPHTLGQYRPAALLKQGGGTAFFCAAPHADGRSAAQLLDNASDGSLALLKELNDVEKGNF